LVVSASTIRPPTTAVSVNDLQETVHPAEKILTIVLPLVLFIVILVLTALGIYACMTRRRRRTTTADGAAVLCQQPSENGKSMLMSNE